MTDSCRLEANETEKNKNYINSKELSFRIYLLEGSNALMKVRNK